MKPTYRTIIQNHFQQFQADVSMAAYSIPKPNWQADATVDYYRFWLIEKGEGLLQLNGRTHEVKPGQLYFLPIGSTVSFGNDGRSNYAIYWCNFRASIGDARVFEMLQMPAFIIPDCAKYVASVFERMIDAFRSTLFTRELRLRSALLEIMASYLEHCGLGKQLEGLESIEKLDCVLQYIEDHLNENIAVDELARLAYLHPNYFIGYFKNVVGCSPIQYVNGRRLERAKQLLEKSDISVSEIARQVGLQNHYLSRMFKQHTGVSPSRYRQIYLSAYGEVPDAGLGSDDNP
jgi:AraC family transcriptional regulator of arabinose operon